LAQLPNLPRELRSTQALIRFCLRTSILIIFAAFGSIGFGRSLAALLGMSIILSAVMGAMKREPPFATVLNHWDETIAYGALFCLVSGFNYSVPL
jgi:membrane associated rhomboid family serine protease